MNSDSEQLNHSPESLRDLTLRLLDDRLGKDLVALDVRGISGFTDYMILVTGTSARHVKTLAQHLMEETKALGIDRIGVEGMESLDWVLIDLLDVVVHVMRDEARKYYDLERMWAQAAIETEGGPEGVSQR